MPPEADKPDDDATTPKYITAEELNKALGGYRTRIKGDIDKAMSSITTKLGEMLGKGGDAPDGGDGEEGEDEPAEGEEKPGEVKAKGGKAATLDPASARRLKAAERAAKTANDTAETERNLRLASEAKVARDEERTKLSQLFKDKGVREGLIGDLVSARMAEGMVVRDPDDATKIMWAKGKDEFVELDVGVGDFLKTPTGKEYLPAKGGTGSGVKPGSRTPSSGADAKGNDMPDDEFVQNIM